MAYWLILAIAMLESLVFAGSIIPGSILVVIAGFFSARGVLDVGDLIWFVAVGAFLGDATSYWLGSKGKMFFRNENVLLKMSHLEAAERFFKKHGSKSVFFGRFVGPLRPIVPFVAGLSKMNRRIFFIWSAISALLWSASHILVGYFFGGALGIVEVWLTRAGYAMVVAVSVLLVFWFLVKKSRAVLGLAISLARSIKQGIAGNPDVKKMIARHPHVVRFFAQRMSRDRFSGLPFTLLMLAFVYVSFLFFGVVEDIVRSDAIVAADVRVANLFLAFRDARLIAVFMWVTVLGKWQIVLGAALASSSALWIVKRRSYILPLWVSISGSTLFNLLGKLAFHRARPEVAYYSEHGFSFPSGHATIAVALYGFLTYIFFKEATQWGRRVNIVFTGLIVAVAIGFSRLYLDVHYVSDVWAGYLLGFLWLIIGIALHEWMQSNRPLIDSHRIQKKRLPALVCFIWVLMYIWVGVTYHPTVNTEKSVPTVVTDDILTLFESGDVPATTETVTGGGQEPINFLIVAKDDETVIQALNSAGWQTADSATPRNVLRLARAAAQNTRYQTAPMTPSFWNAGVHNFGFEKETGAQNARERHHARVWRTPYEVAGVGRLYVGTVSLDTGLKWLVVHTISPDIDTERENLFDDLRNAAVLESWQKRQLVNPVLGQNFGGDAFFTDGEAYQIILKP